MSVAASVLGISPTDHPLRQQFMKWQCRVRQLAMRDNHGRPDDAITPEVLIAGDAEPMGHIITVMNKAPAYSLTAELQHMARKTHDPAQRREQALQFLSATYYQKQHEFSDILTATFLGGSKGAEKLHKARNCTLTFEAYAQRFDLKCKVWRLADHNPLYQATMAHNQLFNPAIAPDTIILGFEPDWQASSSARN